MRSPSRSIFIFLPLYETTLRSERLAVIPAAMDFVLGLEDGNNRYIKAVSELGKAFALVSSMDEAIARDLVQAIRNNVTIDWTMKEGVRAKLRGTVKRLLKKYGYPPDKQEKATTIVLQQAELLCKNWIS